MLGWYRWRARAATSVVKRERKKRLEAEKAMIIAKERSDARSSGYASYDHNYPRRHRVKAGDESLRNRRTEVYRHGGIREGNGSYRGKEGEEIQRGYPRVGSSLYSSAESIGEGVSIRMARMEKREGRGSMEEGVFDGLQQRRRAMTIEGHSRNMHGQAGLGGRRLGRIKAFSSNGSTGIQDEGELWYVILTVMELVL